MDTVTPSKNTSDKSESPETKISPSKIVFGNWKFVESTPESPHDPDYGVMIPATQTIWIANGHPVAKEIAHLISASSDLYVALKDIMSEADFGDEELKQKCLAAIAKAEGKI